MLLLEKNRKKRKTGGKREKTKKNRYFTEIEPYLYEFDAIDLSPYNQNFDLGKSRQICHHSLKEHHKISNIPKFRCEML